MRELEKFNWVLCLGRYLDFYRIICQHCDVHDCILRYKQVKMLYPWSRDFQDRRPRPMTSRNKAGCAAQMLVFDLGWRLSKEREPEVIRRDVVMEKWAYLDEPDGYTLSLVET